MGTMGEITFDATFMQVLGVKPGDSISFFIDPGGVVTVKGIANPQIVSPQPMLSETPPRPGEVTQAALFPEEVAPSTKRRNRQ